MKRGERFCTSSWPNSVVTAPPTRLDFGFQSRVSDVGSSVLDTEMSASRVFCPSLLRYQKSETSNECLAIASCSLASIPRSSASATTQTVRYRGDHFHWSFRIETSPRFPSRFALEVSKRREWQCCQCGVRRAIPTG